MKFAKEIYKEYPTLLMQRANYFRKVYNEFEERKQFEFYLDLGCGKGYNTRAFKDIAKRFIGLEPIKQDLKEAKRNNPEGQFYNGNATYISFENETFDVISSFSVLEHISELDKALDEINRVLVKGGVIILQQPNKFFFVELHTYLPLLYVIPIKLRRKILLRLGYSEDAILATQLSVGTLLKKLNMRGIHTQCVKMIYPEQIIPKKFRSVYLFFRSIGLFKVIPFGYFIVGHKK
ncbi:class I SAM-dependent methyltransferase [Candidatus Woesearchaeota archaeon]|nr:class I SAM-dependent methyltransferase [Candidatus Woesearchaeota archaeon]